MYVLSQRHPVWVTENHVNPCNSVVPRLPVELPADADPGIVDITLIRLFMWSQVCQLNSPQTQTPA